MNPYDSAAAGAVWRRVTGTEDGSDAAVLLDWMADEAAMRRAFLSLAQRMGREAATLRQLAATAGAHARTLGTLYYLQTGTRAVPPERQATPIDDPPAALRALWERARSAAARYARAAQNSENRTRLQRLSDEETKCGESIFELLERELERK
jgi:hypothetical protein